MAISDRRGSARQQAVLCLCLFSTAYAAQAVSPVMLAYTVDLRLSAATLALFFSVYALGLAIAFLIGGPMSDQRGRRAVVVPSLWLLLASVLALVAAAEWGEPLILVGRFVQGLASGAAFTVGTVWLRELAGSRRATAAMMQASGVMALGFAVGPFVSGVLVQWLPWPKVLSMLVALAAVAAAVVLIRMVPESMTERRPGRLQIGLPAGTRRGFLAYLLPCGLLVYTFAMLSLISFPVQLGAAGFTQVYVLLGVSALLVQGLAALATLWALRIGAATAGWLSGLCAGAGCVLGFLAMAPGQWQWVIPASVLIGVAEGLAIASGVAVCDLLAPAARRGALISMFYIVAYVGYASPTLLSWVWGSQVMAERGTILGLGVAAAVLMVVLAGPGRAVVRHSWRVTAGSTAINRR